MGPRFDRLLSVLAVLMGAVLVLAAERATYAMGLHDQAALAVTTLVALVASIVVSRTRG